MPNHQPQSRYFQAMCPVLTKDEEAWADITTALTELEWVLETQKTDEQAGKILSNAWRAVRFLQRG